MILKHLLCQIECQAYVMDGKDYKEGHPTFHPFCIYEQRGCYLVNLRQSPQGDQHAIVSPRNANGYMLIEATDEEKQKLIEAGYKMIGLNKNLINTLSP
jgi:hypothetical protein